MAERILPRPPSTAEAFTRFVALAQEVALQRAFNEIRLMRFEAAREAQGVQEECYADCLAVIERAMAKARQQQEKTL